MSFSSNNMTSSGRVAPLGFFGGVTINAVRPGAQAPEIVICHGQGRDRVEIARCDAVAGARIDVEQPVHCPDGIWLFVLGEPHDIDVTVWHG